MNRFLAPALFLACIVAANWATTHYGMWPVGFGLMATAGTYFAGFTFVLRDSVHDTWDRRSVIALIVLGAGLSLILALLLTDPGFLPPGVTPARIALASGAAFLVAELADLAVYAPLRRRGYIRAAVASNVVGGFIDTVVFLAIAGFPILPALPGQMLAKLTVTAVVVLIVGGARAVLRKPVNA